MSITNDSRDTMMDEIRRDATPLTATNDAEGRDAEEVPPEHREEEPQHEPDRPQQEASMFGSFTVFRDFFLAAFSDGYNSSLCAVDDMTNCCKGSKVAPLDNSSQKMPPNASSSSFDAASVPPNASQQQQPPQRRRKKPLAVAVGFNYTKDANGRPIVITPTGTRTSPIDLTHVRNSPPHNGHRALPPPPPLPVLHPPHPDVPTTPPGMPNLQSRPSRNGGHGALTQSPLSSY